jgi:hypothetical protein
MLEKPDLREEEIVAGLLENPSIASFSLMNPPTF